MSETWQVSCFTNKTASSISRTTRGGGGGKRTKRKKKEKGKEAAGNNATPAINPLSLAASQRCLPSLPYIHPTRRGTFPTLSRGSALISEEKKREQKRPEKSAV